MKVKTTDETGSIRRQSIAIKVTEVEKSRIIVKLSIYDDIFEGKIFQGSLLKREHNFEVSAFDLPYMDNIKLSDGSRFSLVLKSVWGDTAEIGAIRFKNDFITLRDRPLFEEMLKKLDKSRQ